MVRLFLQLVVATALCGASGGLWASSGALRPGEHTTTLNQLSHHYVVAGRGPVALVPAPGWGPSSEYLARSLKPLEQSFTLVYFDPRGTGRSPMPAAGPVSWSTFVADLEALRRHLGVERTWLIGHSMAGVMVTHYALTHPDKAAGLVLIDTPAAADALAGKDMQARLAQRSREPWFPVAIKAFNENPTTQPEFDRSLREALPLYFAKPARIAAASDIFEGPPSIDAWRGAQQRLPDVLGRLGELQLPTVIVVGADDFIASPVQAKRMHEKIAGSKLVVIEDAGHFPWIEQPAAFFEGVRSALPPLETPPK